MTHCKTDQDTTGLSNGPEAVKSLVEMKIKLEISSSGCYRKIKLTPYLGALIFSQPRVSGFHFFDRGKGQYKVMAKGRAPGVSVQDYSISSGTD